MKILLVDDQPEVLDLISLVLKKQGHTVVPASNANEGLHEFRKDQFDFIISDVHMPRRNGTSLIKEIRDMGFDGPVVFISGDKSDELMKKVLSLDAFDFLIKPFTNQEIIEITNEASKPINEERSFFGALEKKTSYDWL